MKTDRSPNSAQFTGDWPGSYLPVSMLSTFRTNTVYGNCRGFFQFHQEVHWFFCFLFLFNKCSKAEYKTTEDMLQLFDMDRTEEKRKL